MDLRPFIDSTYLKTPQEAGISVKADREVVVHLVQEAVKEGFKAVVLRPNHVGLARKMVDEAQSALHVVSVVDFPKGTASLAKKIDEANRLIERGVDELDFVIDYKAYKAGHHDKLKEAVYEGTRVCLEAGKICKWIVETAALSEAQIEHLTLIIRDVVVSNFGRNRATRVFVKSATGYYETAAGIPSGATVRDIKILVENSGPLGVKASGGIRNRKEAERYVKLGVQRIGTSSAAAMLAREEK
ncbi:MAG: deoxyribose-phosphate aldolase [Flavobacteriales bacterium]